MICKKLWKEDLLHLVLLLSLLRIDHSSNYGYGAGLVEVGSHDTRSTQVLWSRNIYDYEVSPKNYESMLSNYERWVFHDLNLLGRYSPIFGREDVTAYVGLTPDEGSTLREERSLSRDSSPIRQELFSPLNDYSYRDESFDPFSEALAPDNDITNDDDPLELANDVSNSPDGLSFNDEPFSDVLASNMEELSISRESSPEQEHETEQQATPPVVPRRQSFEYDEVDPYHVSFSLSELGSPRDWNEEFPEAEEEDHQDSSSDLTQEDMELIEVLWKQDVDMGFSLEEFQEAAALAAADQTVQETAKPSPEPCVVKPASPVPNPASEKPNPIKVEGDSGDEIDLWSGLLYTIDCETGEYILKRETESPVPEVNENEPPSGLLEEDFSLEEALQLVGINDDSSFEHQVSCEAEVSQRLDEEEVEESPQVPNQLTLDDQLKLIQDMIQAPPPPYYHRPLQGHQAPGGGVGPGGIPQSGYGMPSTSTPLPPTSQSRSAYGRSTQEQRWQELANLLGVQPHQDYHHHHHHHYQTNHYPPPPPHPGATGSTKIPPPDNNNLYPIGPGLGNSMNLMTNSSEPMANEPTATTFKMENPNDMLYYQNGSDPNHNPDGFINSILNEDDLLMDMAMNDEAVDPNQRTWKSADNSKCMYTMRMLEGGTGAADSDSAVSSMGSERVPSLTSDTDWMETNSDSGHTPADHFMAAGTDIHSKMRWFDYSYCRQHSGEPGGSNSNHRMPPVAQKKHHLYGKRLFQEQPSANNGPTVPTSGAGSPGGASSTGGGASSTRSPSESSSKFDYNGVNVATPSSQTSVYDHPASPLDMVKPQPQEVKYSCSLEFARQNLCGAVRSSPSDAAVHNHTYHLPPEHLGVLQRPLTRDKRELEKDWDSRDEDEEDLCVGKRGCSDDDISTSRDERRARSLNIPITVSDIINLPMDEFNERLSKFDLSETQLSLIRDIRRRGKNKVAAQNCRKRKLDQILSLADEVKAVRDKKQKLLHERDCLLQERVRVKNTVSQLFRHIFQSLRDEDGNAYSPRDWSLEEAPDGSIVLVPRDASDLTIVRPHLANSSRAENDQDSHDLHQPSTSKKHLHPRKHVP